MLRPELLGDQSLTEDALTSELDERTRALYSHLANLDYGLALLRFLWTNQNSLRTADGIAFHLRYPSELIEHNLTRLVQLDVARAIRVSDLTLFGFTLDPQSQQLARNIFAWQDGWTVRLRNLVSVITGRPIDKKYLGAVALPYWYDRLDAD